MVVCYSASVSVFRSYSFTISELLASPLSAQASRFCIRTFYWLEQVDHRHFHSLSWNDHITQVAAHLPLPSVIFLLGVLPGKSRAKSGLT